MNALVLRLLINGSAQGALQAITQVTRGAQSANQQLQNLGSNPAGLNQYQQSLAAISGQMNSMRSLAGNVLKFAGVSIGISEIISLADAFHNMEGRLKLATQYSGDYSQVLQALRESARSTRSDLVATVDLYSKISTSLKAVGLNSQQAVGIVTTINKAIQMSGTSSEAAAEALEQLGQGLGAGALHGDEFNSVMEQTPGLAQAIADGLGISIGSLRQWANDGKLTAETITKALQKSADSVDANFARMPVTVSQSLTNLRNEFMMFVGMNDNATHSTSALANVINSVASEIADAGPVVQAFSGFFKLLADGLDLSYRLLKVIGLSAAAVSVALKEVLTGNVTGARDVIASLQEQVEAIMQKPLVTQAKVVEATVDSTKKREQLEAQLADQQVRLEKLKEYQAGKTLSNIAAKEKETVDARIAEQQRLVDAVRNAFQQSLSEAEKYSDAAKAKLQAAADYRSGGQSAAFNASISGLSEEAQAQAKYQRMQDLQSQGQYEAARARLAAMAGDVKKYDEAAAEAEKRLKEALQLAQDVKDVGSIEGISNQLAQVKEAGAGLDQKKSEEAKALAQSQAKLLTDLEAQLTALQQKARSIEVQVDMTDAQTKIAGLQAQLVELAKGATVPITVQQTGTPNVTAPSDVTRSYGGALPGWAPSDRADNMLYWGTPGEWVIQRPAVRYWGADFIRAINEMRMPRFAFGGQLGGGGFSSISNLRIPQVSASQQQQMSGMSLIFPGFGSHTVQASADTQADLARTFRRIALAKGN